MKIFLLIASFLFVVPISKAQTNINSLDFDGANDYLFCNNPFTATIGAASYMFYAKFPQRTGGQGVILSDWPSISGTFNISYEVYNGATDRMRWNINTSTGSYEITHDLLAGDFNVWNSWAFIFGGTYLSIFKNGLEVEIMGIPMSTITPSSGELRIGDQEVSSSPHDGWLDDIHLWNVPLSPQYVLIFMDCPPDGSEPGLLAYWNLDDGTGSSAADLSPAGNDALFGDSPTWSMDIPTFSCSLEMDEFKNSEKTIVKIVDLMGRVTSPKKNTVLIYVFDDGSTERVMTF